MANCDNKPADSLVAGTFLGVDCDGNPVGAGGSIATCGNLQGVKDNLTDSIDEAVGEATQDINDRIDNEVETLSNRDDQLDAKIDKEIDDRIAAVADAKQDMSEDLDREVEALNLKDEQLEAKIDKEIDDRIAADASDKAELQVKIDKEIDDRIAADAALRDETKIKSIERTDDTVTIEMMNGTKFTFSIKDNEEEPSDDCIDCGRPVDFAISPDGNNLEITLGDGTKLDLTHQEISDWLASKDGAMATDEELQGVYDALDADKVSKDDLCGLVVPCVEDMLVDLAPNKFIEEQVVQDGKLVSTYNTGDTIETDLPADQFITKQEIIGDKLVSTYSTGGTIEVELPIPDTDQATLFIQDDDLVLKNEDESESKVPLNSLIQVSPDDGNEIEMRDNGIYYGTIAPPNLANLYVDGELGDDSLSVDDGGGSIDNPFKTLEQALKVTPEDKNNTIHLKATLSDNITEQTYSFGRITRVRSSVVRTIKTYGQPLLTDEVGSCLGTKDGLADVEFSAMFKRPKILMDWFVDENLKRQRKQYVYLYSGSKLEFRGVHLMDVEVPMDESEYTVFNNLIAMGSGELHFKACILEDHADSGATGIRYRIFGSESTDSQVASFLQCYFENFRPVDTRLFTVRGALTLLVASGKFTTQAAADHCLPVGSRDISALDSNAAEILSRPALYNGLVRGNSGDPLNITSNIVI